MVDTINNVPSGMKLVGNEKKVAAISRAVERCDGFCPCVHTEEIINQEDLRCPCLQSRVENICVCGLYEKA